MLSTSLMASDETQAQIDELKAEIKKLKKIQNYTNKTLSQVKAHDAYDNIKYGMEFRNAVDMIEYKNNDTGETFKNDNLLTSRLFLTMASAPMNGLMFKGKLAIYSMWGAHLEYDGAAGSDSAGLKDWSGSSKPSDTLMRLKEAYFVYSNKLGSQPISFSVGRRPASNGFLANFRENEDKPGSPSAHITNMEVNGAMVKLSWNRFIPGAYTKFVYGRAHTGENAGVYGDTTSKYKYPYADISTTAEDDSVDFFVVPGIAYNNGQYEVMYQWAHIFETKGKALNGAGTADDVNKAGSGVADLFSVGLKVSGIGNEINDFLDETTFFISGAYTKYNADSGYSILGSESGGSKSGSSIWTGIIMPDMITEGGKIGFEYNQGSKNWTPMTWAEDTITGSKIAVRGYAAEAYWNFDLFGAKYLPSQVRYTYAQHDYTPNINCAGWVAPTDVDLTSSDLRFSITYTY
jgi:hypothetical protein